VGHIRTHILADAEIPDMLNSLPDRPISKTEADTLSTGEEVEVVFPPAPESITEDTDGELRIHDLLVFTGERVVAIVYLDAESEWSVIADEDDTDGDAYEVVYGELVEHRGYEDIDREDAMQQVVTKLYGIPPELIEAHPEKLESLNDR
jgi:hypothetical protein